MCTSTLALTLPAARGLSFILAVLLVIVFVTAASMNERPLAAGKVRTTRELLSKDWDLKSIKDIRYQLSTNDRFVPVIGSANQRRKMDTSAPISFFEKRTGMFDMGLYPGVEYRIKEIIVRGESISSLQELPSENAIAEEEIQLIVRPAYKLIPELERQWPITVTLRDIPWCLSRGAYNVVTVAGSLSLAASFLFAAFIASLSLTLSVVNTRSMVPSIIPKDIILVEKVTPTIKKVLHIPVAKARDILFFTAPQSMLNFIDKNKYPKVQPNSLIIKRVRDVQVREGKAEYDMRGDFPSVSIDSRDWGLLDEDQIVGTPLLRIWPLNRLGPVI